MNCSSVSEFLLFMFLVLQVQSWFRDKQTNLAAVAVAKPQKKTAGSKTAIIKKTSKGCFV